MSEASAGSDVVSMKCTAVKNGNHLEIYLVHHHKN